MHFMPGPASRRSAGHERQSAPACWPRAVYSMAGRETSFRPFTALPWRVREYASAAAVKPVPSMPAGGREGDGAALSNALT